MRLRPGRLLPAVLIITVMLFQGRFAWHVLESDIIYFNAQRDMVFWGNNGNNPAPETVAAVSSAMDRALALRQRNPDYLSLKARLQAWEGIVATDSKASLASIRQAADTMEKSLGERPANPYSWLQLAEYLRVLPGNDADFRQALEKARVLAPGDKALQQRVADLKAEGGQTGAN